MDSVIVSVFIIFLGISASFFAFISALQQLTGYKKRKRISYSFLVDSPFTEEGEKYIKMLPQGETVTEARLVVIRIQNIGDRAVHPKDYYVPITFDFGDRIISNYIGGITPAGLTNVKANLALPTRPDEQSLALDQIDLKPKEGIIMSVLVAGPPDRHIKVKGRIIDGGLTEHRTVPLTARP